MKIVFVSVLFTVFAESVFTHLLQNAAAGAKGAPHTHTHPQQQHHTYQQLLQQQESVTSRWQQGYLSNSVSRESTNGCFRVSTPKQHKQPGKWECHF